MRTGQRCTEKDLLSYLEREVTKSESDEIEARLGESTAARRELDELRSMLDGLSRPDPRLAKIDLVAGVRQAIEAGPQAPGRSGRRRLLGVIAASVIFVVGSAVAWRALESPDQEIPPVGLRVKLAGDRNQATSLDRWVNIRAYHTDRTSRPTPLGAELPRGRGLLFTYTNMGPSPYSSLLIFAVSAAGQIHWYHPAYERPGEDPAGIRIKAGGQDVELREGVEHDLTPGPLTIYGLFTRTPVRVLQVEAMIEDLVRQGRWDRASPPRLPVEGAAHAIIQTRVPR